MIAEKTNNKIIKEAVEDKLPRPLPHDQVLKFIEDVKPGIFFHLGYVRELGKADIAAKFRGGKGSGSDGVGAKLNFIRIFKCSEMYGCTGVDYEAKQSTIDMRANTGKERVGNKYQVDMVIPNKVMRTAYGDLLQFYPREGDIPKVKWFISTDNGTAHATTKEDVVQYLTPAAANKVVNHVERDKATSGAAVMRFNIDKIYRIGNLGSTIMIDNGLGEAKCNLTEEDNKVESGKEICPKCGKEVCECNKTVTEEICPKCGKEKDPNCKDCNEITEASKTPEEKAAEAQEVVNERKLENISAITSLIKDKFSNVEDLKGIIGSLKENGAPKSAIDIVESMIDDETIHIGMAQKALSIIAPDMNQAIKSGEEKASAVASEPANNLK